MPEGEARTRLASSSGFSMPATAFIAEMEWRIAAADTSSSRSARRVRNWPRSWKL